MQQKLRLVYTAGESETGDAGNGIVFICFKYSINLNCIMDCIKLN